MIWYKGVITSIMMLIMALLQHNTRAWCYRLITAVTRSHDGYCGLLLGKSLRVRFLRRDIGHGRDRKRILPDHTMT